MDPASRVYVSDEVREVERLHRRLFTDEFRRLAIREQLDRQAKRLVEGHASGDRAITSHIKCWHPEMVGWPSEEIMNRDFSLHDARETMAREYGFADWSDVERRGSKPPDPEFEAAVDAIVDGDAVQLCTLLQRRPSLARQRSDFGHRSTLLHYVGSNGVETHRQRVPLNLAEIAQTLIDAGADVNAAAEMYGGGVTAIGLLITSGHPAEAGIMDEVVHVLVDAGAETDDS